MRTQPRTTHPRLLLALGALGALVLAGCSGTASTPVPAGPPPGTATATGSVPGTATGPSTAGTAPGTSATAPLTPAPAPGTGTGRTAVPSSSLVALWPFTTAAQVRTWQAEYRAGGRQPWHLDVARTALGFARDHLRYSEIDRVTTQAVNGADARVGVGWKDEGGRPHTVGVLHLIRFGTGADAPWVVVGTDDTSLTLTAPRYGGTVTSPLRAGGVITGVDESLHVIVVGPAASTPLGEVTGIPAGGERTPWTADVAFTAPRGAVLTVAVSTGGHLKAVERFAVTAVRVS